MFVIERLVDGAWKRGIDYFWNQQPAIAVAHRQMDKTKQTHRVVSYPDPTCFEHLIPYVPPAPIDAAAFVKEIWG